MKELKNKLNILVKSQNSILNKYSYNLFKNIEIIPNINNFLDLTSIYKEYSEKVIKNKPYLRVLWIEIEED